jgi:O-antigen ligase
MNVALRRAQGVSMLLPPKVFSSAVPGDVVAVFVSALVALDIGVAVAGGKPVAALLPVAAVGGVLLLVDARARILFLVFGGILTLQSSESLGLVKLAYLAGVVVSFGGALYAFSQSRDWFKRGLAMPLLRVSVAVCALVMVSLLVAREHGVPRTDWLRDVAPYLLFALAPIFALDAQWAFSRSALIRLFVGAGSLATASFTVHWLEQRRIAELPFSSFALSSFFVPAALFAYAIAAALDANHRRIRWLSLAALVFSSLVVTGTRSTLILALAPVIVALGARRHLGARFFRLVLLVPVALLVIAAATVSIVEITNLSTTVISQRIEILKDTGTSEDASYRDRQAQTHVARDVFYANPILGAGPGTYFNWTVANGEERSAFILDSPVAFPAKFGGLGLAVVVFLVLSYASFLRSVLRFNHPRPETLALTAYAALAVAVSFLTNPLEDKGCAFGLVLLLALVFRTSAAPASVPLEPRTSS